MEPGLKLGPIHYSLLFNWTHNTSANYSKDVYGETALETQPSSLSALGVITATLVGLLLSSHGSVHKVTHVVKYPEILQWSIGLVLLVFVLPLFAILQLYRCFVIFFLKMKSSTFIALMEGPDAVWNMKDSSEPIITTLIEVETNYDADYLLSDIRDAILRTILSNPKLSWSRNYTSLGFSYWEMCTNVVSLKQHVKWMKSTNENRTYITPPELQLLLSDISSHGLTNNTSCWEILVSQQYLRTERKNFQAKVYPIILRIHHSLGDGVSLLNILMKNICALAPRNPRTCTFNFNEEIHLKEEESKEARKIENVKIQKQNKKNSKETDNIEGKKRGIIELSISNGKVNFLGDKIDYPERKSLSFSTMKILLQFSSVLKSGKYIVKRLYKLLNSLNIVRKSCKFSALDADKLSGKKIIAWYNDSPEGSLFSSIKLIKSQNNGIRFTDIILTMFSSSIEKYLKRLHQHIPNCISVVVPVYPTLKNYPETKENRTNINSKYERHLPFLKDHKLPQNFEVGNVQLQNSFSLGVLNLPVNIQGKVTRLHQVSKNVDILYGSGQFAFNLFLLRWIAKLFPHQLLSLIFSCAIHNTAVISNLIGPTFELPFAGYPMKNVCFWVPHRGNTGISMSIISYCNRLQMGIMADASIISSGNELQCILHDIVSDVMHQVDKIKQNEKDECKEDTSFFPKQDTETRVEP